MVAFIRGEMQWRIQDGFSILLHAADAVQILGGVGGVGGARGGTELNTKLFGAPGGYARVWVRYNAHLSDLYLWGREKLRTLLTGTVLPTLHGHVLCKNWPMYGVCWLLGGL